MNNGLHHHGYSLPTLDEIKRRRMQLLAVIVDRAKAQQVTQIFQHMHVHFHFLMLAQGTAKSEILDLLGIDAPEKTVVLSLIPDIRISAVMAELLGKLHLNRAGGGVAFAMPLSGVGSLLLRLLGDECFENFQNEVEKEVDKMSENASHDLIVAVINPGCGDTLMTAAKAAGATGGTVIHAHRVGMEEDVRFFGISIHSEKEIVAILTSREKKRGIMRAVSESCGMKTEARGIVFSMPVDSVAGLDFSETN